MTADQAQPAGQGPAIEAFYLESRTFPPPETFAKEALVVDDSLFREAEADLEGFWARQATSLLDWFEAPQRTLTWELPFARWFEDGKLNVSFNCLDRHVSAGQGDRVAIYLPMIPELPVAMLACSRIGAPHSVVFGGFSADALRDRIQDGEAKVLITADGGWRRGNQAMLKPAADVAVADCPSITDVVVVRRTETDISMTEGRDHWWHEVMEGADATCPPEPMDSEDLLYLLYTSGTTAKPKGIMHTTAGYLTQVAFTHRYVFDLHPERDIYWCAADIGWV